MTARFSNLSPTRIEKLETFLIERWCLLRIHCEDGTVGTGEAGVHGWPRPTAAMIEEMKAYLVGRDPSTIEHHAQALQRHSHFMGALVGGAISAIDIALWDIKAKRAGMPLYQMLGGPYRTEIPLYANYWFIRGGDSPEDYRKQAKAMVACGFRACKFDPFQHTSYSYGDHLSTNLELTEQQRALAIDRLKAVQEAVGPDFPIAIETHAMLNAATAVAMAHRIHRAGIRCMWYEEPAGPEFPEAIADIRRRIPIPVCAGERVHSRYQALPLLQRNAVDFLMPDITRCGGVSEMRKIATLAETFNVPIAPHNPNGPVCTIASAHVMASIPNFHLQEFMLQDVPWRDTVLNRPLPVRNGAFHLDEQPGLGFDLNEDELQKHPGVITPRAGFYI